MKLCFVEEDKKNSCLSRAEIGKMESTLRRGSGGIDRAWLLEFKDRVHGTNRRQLSPEECPRWSGRRHPASAALTCRTWDGILSTERPYTYFACRLTVDQSLTISRLISGGHSLMIISGCW